VIYGPPCGGVHTAHAGLLHTRGVCGVVRGRLDNERRTSPLDYLRRPICLGTRPWGLWPPERALPRPEALTPAKLMRGLWAASSRPSSAVSLRSRGDNSREV